MRPDEARSVVDDVVRRVHAGVLAERRHAPVGYLESLINDAVHRENERVRRAARGTPGRDADRAFWRRAQRRLQHASEVDRVSLLHDIVARHAGEIVGSFDPGIHRFTVNAVPLIASVALNTISPRKLLADLPRLPRIHHNIVVQGEIDHARRLDDLGTLIVVPTHASHLDSVTVGWAAHQVGLPPLTYGAGINLFTNPVLSFFMHNLGSYKVDRKKTHDLYKRVLKEYATVTLERGYDNLFFPGGTRSRNGAIERRLKLGLLGTGLTAYVNNLRRRRPKPGIFIVPCTASYHLVLEAETLIDDHLKEEGKSRYIIEDDEASSWSRWITFVRNLWALDARIYVTFGRPLDLFGNPVDLDGRSLDPRGRVVDPRDYVLADGEPVHDEQRNAEYTKDLGRSIVGEFLRQNVILSTHVLATAVLALLQHRTGRSDVYRLLREMRPREAFDLRRAVYPVVEAVLAGLRRRAERGELRLGDDAAAAPADALTDGALRHFRTYHREPVVVRDGAELVVRHKNLVLYYHGRLDGYGVLEEARAAASAADAAGDR